MTHRDKLVKLAEIAGYEQRLYTAHVSTPIDDTIHLHKYSDSRELLKTVKFTVWNPYENIAQAFECLEVFEDYRVTKFTLNEYETVYECEIDVEDEGCITMTVEAESETREKAICEAVLKARAEG